MIKKLKILAIACSAALLGVVGANVAVAHHSPASYDLTKRSAITGTIKTAMFRNPHGRIVLMVGKEQWKVETSAANLLRRRGWDFRKFRPGTKVTLYGHMNKTIKNDFYVREVKFADGAFFGDKEGNDKALD